ncbi:MAG TPA: hypothetical protein VFN07_10900 [Trueperaceae bacterium]|nr:hypothetical protein [Trueperaceae bacterium]
MATDWAKFREEQEAAIYARGYSKEELLEKVREGLRGIKLTLPTYRSVQEERRYAMTVEDVEEQELMYTQLANDAAGVFEHEDYVEAYVRILEISEVISHVFQHGAGTHTPRAAATGRGCLVFLASTGAAVATVVTLL